MTRTFGCSTNVIAWTRNLLMLASLTACGAKSPATSDLEFDAGHSVALDGVIPQGRILSASVDDKVLETEIRGQLLYSVGQLNGINGVARLSLNTVQILSKKALGDGSGLNEVIYATKIMIAWDRYRAIPKEYSLVLPASGNPQKLQSFLNSYQYQCINEDGRQHGVDIGSYWYYYRPQNCGLSQIAGNRIISVFPVQLSLSKENTSGKSPEYGEMWKDGRLTITTIFAKYEGGRTSDSDPGIAAYNSMYWSLLNRLGSPSSINVRLQPGYNPGVSAPDLQMVFQSQRGPVDVHMILIDDITKVDEAFKKHYNERSRISDFISYSGHSGLGENVRTMATLGSFAPGKYQLFMINGCDSFAYADHSLRDAHAAVNPNASPSKYFDLITNAMPSYFNNNALANMSILNALLASQGTYQEILSRFDINQRAVVTGEEDNMWPAPF